MTKLEKTYVSSHLYEICVNLLLVTGIITFCLSIAPIAFALIFCLYALVAIWLCIIIILITVGLVFADHNNVLYKILERLWSGLTSFNFSMVESMQITGLPIITAITGVLLVIVFITTLANKSRYGKAKPIVFMIITLVFLIIAIFVLAMLNAGAK
ncbi:MAG: hypothetical protein K5925_00545 [Bacilli bacterium]|nr:hypothetical protein [Bacilli bacterium]